MKVLAIFLCALILVYGEDNLGDSIKNTFKEINDVGAAIGDGVNEYLY